MQNQTQPNKTTDFGKLEAATLWEQAVAEGTREPNFCYNCSQKSCKSNLAQCSQYKVAKYCSKECHVVHWQVHKSICCAIKQAELNYEQNFMPKTMHMSHMTIVGRLHLLLAKSV